MSALPDRDAIESRLLEALGEAGREATEAVLRALGNPPDPARLTPELIARLEETYRGVLEPALGDVFREGAAAAAEEAAIEIDFDVVNEQAASWARQYTYELLQGVTDNSRRMIQEAVGDFFDESMTNRELEERIARVFGQSRAHAIAVTEVTRAAVEGERVAVAELNKELRPAGMEMVAVWNTVNDDLVCPVCGPRNQRKHGDGWTDFPPAHVGCRCFIAYTPEAVSP